MAFGLYNGGEILMAWASIERHILIFNDRWMITKRGTFLVHYLPLILILSYIFFFIFMLFFIFLCENTYTYDLPVCNAYPCYQNDPVVGAYDCIDIILY